MKSFAGHLPEIAIDERYLENLRFSRMSSSDKAEKIIRDIETVIRTRESESGVYVEFDERLQELIRLKKEQAEDIERILMALQSLYSEIELVGLLPQRMGFSDRGTFDLFMDIKNASSEAFDEASAHQFVDVLVNGLKGTLYSGWQESELERRRVETSLKTLADGDDYATLRINENENLVEVLMKRIIQHYSVE